MAAGRPRKFRPRKPCGRLRQEAMEPAIDKGTPETQARRSEAFGKPDAHGQLDRVLDRLRARLTTEQYWAGDIACMAYERYNAAIHAPRVVAGQLQDFVQGGGVSSVDPEAAQKAVDRYRDIISAIRRYSLRSLKQVERVMRGSRPTDIDALRVGLTALADHLGFQAAQAA